MPIMTDAAFILPDDFADAALMGRIWRPDLASPSVVAIRQDGVFDITENFPTASQLAEVADPAAALRAARGERVGVLQDLLTNTPPDNRDPTKPWLLAPIDLQVTKAPVLSAVGTCMDAGLHPKSVWNNPEPEVVLAVASDGRNVGASLGNDVNLRDFEGRSALLL